MNRLFLLNVLFCIAYEIPAQRIVHPRLSVTAQLGESVTLECSVFNTHHTTQAWFKQVIGQPPMCILKYDGQADPTFFDKFNNKSRFQLQNNGNSLNLTILKMESSDMAIYYCGGLKDSCVFFGNGTALLLKGIESRGRIIQPHISESVQSYYCAVVTCGEASNGNQAKEDGKAGDESLFTPPVIVLAGTNIVLLISVTVLVCLRIKEGKCKSCSDHTVEDYTNVDSANDQNQQMLDYAALDFDQRRNKPRKKKRAMNKESVYAEVRVQQRE
ncbi:immunoglobulin kappa light chain-like isoform X4 [Acipenser oxyrinchus oxyrinchus]|nr:immunoglobulin kappa light chain-like isoform X4 [Acipenser oxyrinchus oxyrinchus]